MSKLIYLPRNKYLDSLIIDHAVKIEKYGFTLKNGIKSHVYVDSRDIFKSIEYTESMSKILYCSLRENNITPDYYIGVPDSGSHLANSISRISNLNTGLPESYVQLRKVKKDYGINKNFTLPPDKKVENGIVIEDVTTTGGSILETIERLEEEDVKIGYVFTLINRGNDEISNLFTKKGIDFITYTTLDDIIYRNSESIGKEKMKIFKGN